MKKMILVPTDFSDNARVATRYAVELAKHMGYEIHLIHAYSIFRSAFQNRKTSSLDSQRAESEAKSAMDKFITSLGTPITEITLSTSLRPGHLVDVVNEHTRNNPDVLVVMGTHGATGSRLGLLGTNTYDIAKSIKTPLLIVPEHVNEFRLSTMVFFTDFQEWDKQTLKGYAALFGETSSQNILVHIRAEKTDNALAQMDDWKTQLQDDSGLSNLTTQLIVGKESVSLVHETLANHDADLTVLTLVGGRGFFEKLVTKSLARAIILHPQTPILLIN